MVHKQDWIGRRGASSLCLTTFLKLLEAELEPVRLILSRRADGNSFRTLARSLTDAVLPTKCGGRWEASTVRKVWERRERYAPAMAAA
jgi:hypothetical protein